MAVFGMKLVTKVCESETLLFQSGEKLSEHPAGVSEKPFEVAFGGLEIEPALDRSFRAEGSGWQDRGLFRSQSVERRGGEGLPLIGKLLGHRKVTTTARYAHLARDTEKASAAKVGASIGADLLDGARADG